VRTTTWILLLLAACDGPFGANCDRATCVADGMNACGPDVTCKGFCAIGAPCAAAGKICRVPVGQTAGMCLDLASTPLLIDEIDWIQPMPAPGGCWDPSAACPSMGISGAGFPDPYTVVDVDGASVYTSPIMPDSPGPDYEVRPDGVTVTPGSRFVASMWDDDGGPPADQLMAQCVLDPFTVTLRADTIWADADCGNTNTISFRAAP
jgi:hypothetical protein